MKDKPISEMSKAELQKKAKELTDRKENVSLYGSPWGLSATKADLYDIDHEIQRVEFHLSQTKLKNITIKVFKTNVKGCARCGKTHKQVEFKTFSKPNSHYSHWALCPNNGEPIMMKMVEEKS